MGRIEADAARMLTLASYSDGTSRELVFVVVSSTRSNPKCTAKHTLGTANGAGTTVALDLAIRPVESVIQSVIRNNVKTTLAQYIVGWLLCGLLSVLLILRRHGELLKNLSLCLPLCVKFVKLGVIFLELLFCESELRKELQVQTNYAVSFIEALVFVFELLLVFLDLLFDLLFDRLRLCLRFYGGDFGLWGGDFGFLKLGVGFRGLGFGCFELYCELCQLETECCNLSFQVCVFRSLDAFRSVFVVFGGGVVVGNGWFSEFRIGLLELVLFLFKFVVLGFGLLFLCLGCLERLGQGKMLRSKAPHPDQCF